MSPSVATNRASIALQSPEFEESVVGGILVHPAKHDDVRALLRPADFSHPALRAIFEAMGELASSSKPIDSLTVVEQMRALETFDKLRAFNGTEYLTELMAKVVTVENIGYHARMVRDASTGRQALDLLSQAQRALLGGEHGADVAEVFGQRLAQLATRAEPQPAPVTAAASIPIERVEWIWGHRIASGMINVLDGDPGLGKSTITTDLAARLTRGEALPGDVAASPPAGVVFVSFEEHPACVMVPRLMAAKADLSRVFIWDLAQRPFDLVNSLAELEAVIAANSVRLVVIDPLMAALPSELNAHRDQDVRSVLAPVAGLAERTGAAILLVRHLNKNTAGGAVYRGGGSIGIIGAARVGLVLASDPDTEDDDAARVLAVSKSNVSRLAAPLRLRLVAAPSPAPGVEVARVEWGGTATISADELVAPREEHGAMARAVELLRNVMKDGPVLASEAHAALEANGVSQRTEARAKEKLGIVAKREGVKGKWWWYMPDQLPPSHSAKAPQ